jgi:hypothetical protein
MAPQSVIGAAAPLLMIQAAVPPNRNSRSNDPVCARECRRTVTISASSAMIDRQAIEIDGEVLNERTNSHSLTSGGKNTANHPVLLSSNG